MEPLFRLALLRPAITQDPENPSVELSQQTDFQRALSVASSTPDPRPELRRVVGAYVVGPLFVGKPEQAPLAKETARFAATLDRLPALASARAAAAAVETRPGPAAPLPPSLRDTVIAAAGTRSARPRRTSCRAHRTRMPWPGSGTVCWPSSTCPPSTPDRWKNSSVSCVTWRSSRAS
ncbi:hypothetical protein ACJ6WF_01990 [Streptomyces sp. MMS24-I2-30]|uniref:hypothetical protein n=1 Tax=Streptomyces sp. MMS24-I2-30 TaxID=3351564 RepID=UPI003896CE31